MGWAEPGLQLLQSQNQHASLGALAQQYQAQDAKDQAVVAQAMLAQTQEIRGTAGGTGTNTQADSDPSSPKPFPEFSAPHLLLASAAGVASTTAGSTSHHSGAHHAITTGEHTSITSGKSWLTVAQNAIRMFSYKGDVRLISAKEDIDIAAIQDTVAMFAKLDITLRGNRVIFNATKSVTISGGGSYTRWSAAGIVSGTLGKWTVHAAKRDQFGPKSLPVPTVSFKGCELAQSRGNAGGSAGLRAAKSDEKKLKKLVKKQTKEKINLPLLIAKSEVNRLSGPDSEHSATRGLPGRYSRFSQSLEDLSTASKARLVEELKLLMKLGNGWAMGRMVKNGFQTSHDMLKVSLTMVDYFASNKQYSIKKPFESIDMNNAVKESEAFNSFKSKVNSQIIDHLKYKKLTNQIKIHDIKNKLAFNKSENYFDGLLITVDQVSNVEVYIDKIDYANDEENKIKKITLRYELYDTYGLDIPDLEKFGLLSSLSIDAWKEYWDRTHKQRVLSDVAGSMFNAWWLLQYKHDCVPFVTKMKVKGIEVDV